MHRESVRRCKSAIPMYIFFPHSNSNKKKTDVDLRHKLILSKSWRQQCNSQHVHEQVLSSFLLKFAKALSISRSHKFNFTRPPGKILKTIMPVSFFFSPIHVGKITKYTNDFSVNFNCVLKTCVKQRSRSTKSTHHYCN